MILPKIPNNLLAYIEDLERQVAAERIEPRTVAEVAYYGRQIVRLGAESDHPYLREITVPPPPSPSAPHSASERPD